MTAQANEDREVVWQAGRQKALQSYRSWLRDNRPQLKQPDLWDIKVSSDMDEPIALRKPKRKNSNASPLKARSVSDNTITVKTPSSRRSKRVRFSEPSLLSTSDASSTSLTPALARAAIGTPSRRRALTPARTTPTSGHIQFTPLRQTLDDRCQRRIRRNGLSEEMNHIEAERKDRTSLQKEIDAKDAELKYLREELAQARDRADHGGVLPHESTSSQEKVDAVEAELEALRHSFRLEESQPVPSWDHVPIGMSGPGSEGGDTICIYEDDDAGQLPAASAENGTDAMEMSLELEAARQAKSTLLGSFRDSTSSFDFHFADSPARRSSVPVGRIPKTPSRFHHTLAKQLKSTTNRAEEAELAFTSLDNELRSLGFGSTDADAFTIISALADHFRQARLELERVVPGETVVGFENAKVLPELLTKLKGLSGRLQHTESELSNSKNQHHNLKVNFERAIIAAENANERVKKLEAALDANVEETLEIRMRAQAVERDLEETNHDVASLTAALDKYRTDVSRLEGLISELEKDYAAKDIVTAQLCEEREQKIDELEAKVSAEERGRRAAEVSAVDRLGKIYELETSLATTKRHAADVEATLSEFQSQITKSSSGHSQEVGSLNTRIATLASALASANAEVEKLRLAKARLEERVKLEVMQGERAVETLQEQLLRTLAKTSETRKSYLRSSKVRTANWEIEEENLCSDCTEDAAPLTPSSIVRFAEYAEVQDDGDSAMGDEPTLIDTDDHVEGYIEISRGRERKRSFSRGLGIQKKPVRRRYDSGVGMSPVDETGLISPDAEEFVCGKSRRSSGILTPDLSSDNDVEAQAGEVDAF